MGVVGQRHAPVPIGQEAGWDPGPERTGAKNLAPTWIRSPDRPAHRESLYRLRYSGISRQILFLKKVPRIFMGAIPLCLVVKTRSLV